MIEILTGGDVTKDFERLGITLRQTYNSVDCGVCELTEEEFKILCDEPDNVYGAWEECGWRYCEGSNQGEINNTLIVRGQKLNCWYKPDEDELEELEEGEDYYRPEPEDLLTYLCDYMGCSAFRNVCALTKDLAKYNNMKLSELFQKYQG